VYGWYSDNSVFRRLLDPAIIRDPAFNRSVIRYSNTGNSPIYLQVTLASLCLSFTAAARSSVRPPAVDSTVGTGVQFRFVAPRDRHIPSWSVDRRNVVFSRQIGRTSGSAVCSAAAPVTKRILIDALCTAQDEQRIHAAVMMMMMMKSV